MEVTFGDVDKFSMYICYEIKCDHLWCLFNVFSIFVSLSPGLQQVTYLPYFIALPNYISCDTIDIENMAKKNLYEIELLPFVLEDPWTSSSMLIIENGIGMRVLALTIIFSIEVATKS